MDFLQSLIEALYPHMGGGGYQHQDEPYRGSGSVPEPSDQAFQQANFSPGGPGMGGPNGPPPMPPQQPPQQPPMQSGQMGPSQTPGPTPPPGLVAEGQVPPWAQGTEFERKPPGYTWEQWREMLVESGRLQL